MKITLHTVKIRDIVDGFKNNEEEGVVGFGGKLNIRPAYQREFVYDNKKQEDVVQSVFKDFPLNVMYWVKNGDGKFELLDGQQRTLSICNYWAGGFFTTVNGNLVGFENLKGELRDQFLDYELQIYICEDGTDQEQLDWFRIINMAGVELTQQELRNAVYTGPWVTSAKKRFSKSGCVAYQLGEKYMSGSPIRQDYLETVLKWISNGKIEEYMAKHQKDETSDAEWQYFQRVIAWVQMLFPTYRREMKGLAWGDFYNRFKDREYSATKLESEIDRLMMDNDVTNRKGIYEYLLGGEEKCLSIRAFTEGDKRKVYTRQKGICPYCRKEGVSKTHYEIDEMEADHIVPWSKGGTTTVENCQMLCKMHNRAKGNC